MVVSKCVEEELEPCLCPLLGRCRLLHRCSHQLRLPSRHHVARLALCNRYHPCQSRRRLCEDVRHLPFFVDGVKQLRILRSPVCLYHQYLPVFRQKQFKKEWSGKRKVTNEHLARIINRIRIRVLYKKINFWRHQQCLMTQRRSSANTLAFGNVGHCLSPFTQYSLQLINYLFLIQNIGVNWFTVKYITKAS